MGISDKQMGLDRSKSSRPSPAWDQNTQRRPKSRSRPEEVMGHGLLDGLPIQHVTKDEWEQMGIVQPALPSSSAVDPPVTYVDRGGKYKEIGPSSSLPSGVRRKLNVMIKTPIELAINVQKCFTTFCSICQGFLGGLALAHFILAYNTGQPDNKLASFVDVYSSYARPYQSLFYTLALVCTVSALDRSDFCHFQVFYKMLRSQPLVLVTSAVSGITLFLSCHTSYWDHRLSTGFHNGTLLEDGFIVSTHVGVWRRLCISRCMGGISAWLLVSLLPSRDAVGSQLIAIQEPHKHQEIP